MRASRSGRSLAIAFLALVLLHPASALDEPYRIGVLRGPTAIAFARLIDEPHRLPDGRVVDVVAYPEPANLVAAYIGGDVDAATLPSNVAAQLSGRGSPIIVGATFIWGVLYLIGPATLDFADLSGDVYSLGRGASPDVVLRYVLREAGLSGRVSIAYGFGHVELAQMLIAARVRVGVLPEPLVTRVLAANPDLGIVADLQELFREYSGSGLPQTVLAFRPGDGAIATVVSLLDASVHEVLADPARAGEVISRIDIGVDADTAMQSLPRLNFRVETGTQSRPALERYFQVLYDFEPAAVGGSLPGDEFYGVPIRKP